MSVGHSPGLLAQVLAGLALRPGASCIDGTVGGGGHAVGILRETRPDGRLLGLDRDPTAISLARSRLEPFGERAVLVQGTFADLAEIAVQYGFSPVGGIVLDLGISSWQLDEPGRGFSFQAEGPLDMRMDPTAGPSAADIVNNRSQAELADVIYQFGEEPRARRIARDIVAARPLQTTTQLADVVRRAAGHRPGQRIHPATRTFQALRIAVNGELAALAAVLPQLVTLLAPGGRLAIISFHSLEDRIVKQFLQGEGRDCVCPPGLPKCVCGHRATLQAVSRKPIRPDEAEVSQNPRSRSARLRVAEKL